MKRFGFEGCKGYTVSMILKSENHREEGAPEGFARGVEG